MKINKHLTLALAAVMAVSSMAMPVLAEAPQTSPTAIADHPSDTMSPTKTVYPIGTKSFYKVEGTAVRYADRDDGTGWTAVPSAYIQGGEYNKDGKDYGMYVTNDGKVHFVDLGLCELKDGVYTWYHGTSDSATVSSDVDTATNEDPTMGTDFYINIDPAAIDPTGTTTETTWGSNTGDPRIDYEITVAHKASYQLNVTVPMYVCMYGYGGDGSIVEPTSEAYQLKNYSTSNTDTSATIVDITKLTHYTRIYDEEHSNEELYAIAYNEATGEYIYWYSQPTVTLDRNWIYNDKIEEEHLNASGECYVIYIDGVWSFKAAGVLDADGILRETVAEVEAAHELAEDFVYGEWNFGKTPAVGDSQEGGKDVGMAVKIAEIQAVPHTWKLVPTSTPVSDILRGELAMSIAPEVAYSNASAIDLSTASAPLNIVENGWNMDAPETDDDGNVTAPSSLGLITKAQMAGGSVNDAGCTSVVSVIYTVVPNTAAKSVQTNTSTSTAANSNR